MRLQGLMINRMARVIEGGMSYAEIIHNAPVWSENTTIYTDINTLTPDPCFTIPPFHR